MRSPNKYRILLMTIMTLNMCLPYGTIHSAFAQTPEFYIRGISDDWNIQEKYRMINKNGVYSIHVDELTSAYTFKICTPDYELQYGSTATFEFDVPMPCINAYGNNFRVKKIGGNETTVYGATLLFDYRNSSAPTLTVSPDIYLVGDVTDWNNHLKGYKFEIEGDSYVLRTKDINGRFKIAAAVAPEWDAQYGGATSIKSGKTYQLQRDGGDMTMDNPAGDYELIFNKDSRRLTVNAFSDISRNLSYYLTGDFNNWDPRDERVRFIGSDGVYKLKIPRLTGEFKITTPDWKWQFGSKVKGIRYNEAISLESAKSLLNMHFLEPVAQEVTMVLDMNNLTLSCDGIPVLYLVGDFNDWTIYPYYAFDYNDGKYTLNTPYFTGEFKIVSSDWSLQLGSKTQNCIEVGDYYSLDFANPVGDNIPFNGIGNPDPDTRLKLILKADATSNAPVILPESEEISNEGTQYEYFNVQGIKIDRPSRGLYIRKANQISEKIYIR